MNLPALSLIHDRAQRQLDAGLISCHITAEQVADICAGCEDALARLAQIKSLIPRAKQEWAENHRGDQRKTLDEIDALADVEGGEGQT